MIKLRIEGTLDELELCVKQFEKRPKLAILNKSKPYKNRGESAYYRVYLDVELKKG